MRAVLFDVDGVVLHSLFHADPALRRRWDTHLLEDMGVDPAEFARFFDESFLAVIEGRKSLVTALEAFLPDIGYRGSPLDFVDYWLSRDTHVNRQLLSLIAKLRSREGVKLYLATNQEHLRALHLWSAVGLRHYFDDIFYAARLGAAKPHLEFFRKVDSLLGSRFDETPLLFDDSPKVIEAAAAHGWEAVHFSDLHDCASHPWIAAQLG